MPDLPNCLTASSSVMLGKPLFCSTRITLEPELRKVSQGATVIDIVAMYPHLQLADVRAGLLYAYR